MIFSNPDNQYDYELVRTQYEALDAITIHEHLVLVEQAKFTKGLIVDERMQAKILKDVVDKTVENVWKTLDLLDKPSS